MSLLTMIQDAAREVGFELPNTVIGNNDATARQLLALLNREGKILSRRHNWTALQREYSFTTVASQEAYALPEDFDRLLNQTAWDRSQRRSLQGPVTPERWQAIKSGLGAGAGIDRRYRIRRGAALNNELIIDPIPASSGESLVFEYISSHWCRDAAGETTNNNLTNDSDLPLLSEDLLTLGLVWRFLAAKGLSYQQAQLDYEREVAQAIARDGGAAKLRLDNRSTPLLGSPQLPETGFGV
ncbi:MAG: hypothetical protein AB7G80_04980 [Dongiaceae bacterium]